MNVNAKLFAHQDAGASWVAAHPKCALWDEQGLGKTATAIVGMERAGVQTLLVVAPTVVSHNWVRELATWAPKRRVQLLTSGRQQIRPGVDTVVTTHGLLKTLLPMLCARPWDGAILDEAHAFKNHKAQRTKAAFGLGPQTNAPAITRAAKRTVLLTGTPMPNNPTELWTMLRALAPERLLLPGTKRPMSWHQFRERYCVLQHHPFGDGFKVVGAKNTAELREKLVGFALRRTKSQCLDLPPLRWGKVALTAEMPDELSALEARVGPVLTDADRLSRLRESEEFATWRRLCGEAKAPAAAELLIDELVEAPTKALVVFAHHVSVLDLLREKMEAAGIATVSITGVVSAIDRQRAVDTFQSGGARVALCNIVAAGVGITLTRASDVVFVEQSFVPGENLQAADRCHRIGQSAQVLARVLTLAGSVDEPLADILVAKTQMIREVIK